MLMRVLESDLTGNKGNVPAFHDDDEDVEELDFDRLSLSCSYQDEVSQEKICSMHCCILGAVRG